MATEGTISTLNEAADSEMTPEAILSFKIGCLFCFVLFYFVRYVKISRIMRPLIACLVPSESPQQEGVHGLGFMKFGSKGTLVTLKATEDKFGGVIIDNQDLPEAFVFLASLKHSLLQWRIQGKRAVWLKLPLDLSALVPLAIQEGFTYHHAEPTHVMLVTWLAEKPSTIPANASHQVGVGAFVLNADGEILVVQEKYGVFQGAGIWKMPTGTVNQGEDIFAAAIREVKEETGIDTEFVEVVGFRQAHKVAFDKSDLFFLCVLRPLSCDITMQDTEVTAVKWMPLADFSHQEYLKQRKMLKKMLDVCITTTEVPAYQGLKVEDMQAGTGRRPQNFYYNF